MAQIQAAVKQAKALKLKNKKGKGVHFPAKYKHDKEVKIKVEAVARAKGTKSKGVKRDVEDEEEHGEEEDDDDDVEEDQNHVDGMEDEDGDENLHGSAPGHHNQESQSLITHALKSLVARARGGGRSRASSKTSELKTAKPKKSKPKTTKPKTTKPKKSQGKCAKPVAVKVGAAAWMFPILKTGVWKSKFLFVPPFHLPHTPSHTLILTPAGMMPELHYVVLDHKDNYIKTVEREPGSAEEFDICVENPKKSGTAAKGGKTSKGKVA